MLDPAEGDRISVALRAALDQPDPRDRYMALTVLQPDVDRLVSAIKVARGEALDELRPRHTWQSLAELVGERRYQKLQELINAARAAQREEQQ